MSVHCDTWVGSLPKRQTTSLTMPRTPLSRRADIEEMMKRTGLKLEIASSSAESGGPVGKAAKMQEELFMHAVAECTEFPSFTKRLYPCWVISLTNLAAYGELVQHEDCIEYLEELLPDSTSPSCAYSFFISQNWEGGRPDPSGHGYHNVRGCPHPDNKLNTKVGGCRVAFSFGSASNAIENNNHHPPHRPVRSSSLLPCVVCRRHNSCAGSSGSSSTWPYLAGARFGFGLIFYRSRNATATYRSKRSPPFHRTRNFARGANCLAIIYCDLST